MADHRRCEKLRVRQAIRMEAFTTIATTFRRVVRVAAPIDLSSMRVGVPRCAEMSNRSNRAPITHDRSCVTLLETGSPLGSQDEPRIFVSSVWRSLRRRRRTRMAGLAVRAQKQKCQVPPSSRMGSMREVPGVRGAQCQSARWATRPKTARFTFCREAHQTSSQSTLGPGTSVTS